MKGVMTVRALILAMILFGFGAQHGAMADDAASTGNYNGACGSITYSSTQRPQPMTVDANGNLCVSQGSAPPTTQGITPVVSSSAEASHVLKASGGVLYSVYASAFIGSTITGNLLILNTASVPADGAVVPIVCIPVPGSAAVGANYTITPATFSTGITAVISSATSCFTKTTGVITGFISGMVSP